MTSLAWSNSRNPQNSSGQATSETKIETGNSRPGIQKYPPPNGKGLWCISQKNVIYVHRLYVNLETIFLPNFTHTQTHIHTYIHTYTNKQTRTYTRVSRILSLLQRNRKLGPSVKCLESCNGTHTHTLIKSPTHTHLARWPHIPTYSLTEGSTLRVIRHSSVKLQVPSIINPASDFSLRNSVYNTRQLKHLNRHHHVG